MFRFLQGAKHALLLRPRKTQRKLRLSGALPVCGRHATRQDPGLALTRNPGMQRVVAVLRSAAHRHRSAVAAAGGLGEADGFFRRLEQGARLRLALGLLGSGIAVGDDAGARLHIDAAVLDEGRAQNDAAVHLAIGREIADAAAVGAALFLLEFVDDLHGAHLRRARQRARGKARHQRVDDVMAGVELACHVARDVHHVAVALDDEALAHAHAADLRYAADVVAAEIDEHQVLGALLGIGEQLGLEVLVFLRRRTAADGAGERTDRHLAVAHAHQDLGARAHERERAEVEMEQERRRVRAAQRAIEGERGQREGRGEALADDDLEHVARGDVFLGARDLGEELVLRGVRHRLGRRERVVGGDARMRHRLVEPRHNAFETGDGCRISRVGRERRVRPHGRDDDHLVLHAVEHDGDGRAHEDAVGHAEAVGRHVRQVLGKPHHVVAHVADDARADVGDVARQGDAGSVEQLAQRGERGIGLGHEGVRRGLRRSIDLGPGAARAPDDVGREADHGVAPAHGAAFDRFQQETHRPVVGQFQHGRDGRLEVGNEARRHDLRAALRVGARESLARRLDGEAERAGLGVRGRWRLAHSRPWPWSLPAPSPSAWRSAASLMRRP